MRGKQKFNRTDQIGSLINHFFTSINTTPTNSDSL